MSRRVVVLSRGGKLLERLMDELDALGARPIAVVLYPEQASATGGSVSGRLRARLLAPLRRARARLHLRAVVRNLGDVPAVVTGPLNSRKMETDLRALAPDVVVLAGCGLLAREVLAVPREGTVSVHPALLPWVRGNGPLENSLLRQVPLGCTAYWLDPGIDTGRLAERRLLPVDGGESAGDLHEGLKRMWAEMTATLVASAAVHPLPPGEPQAGRFPLCRAVRDPARLAAVAAALAAGAPKTLFDRWSPACDPRDLSLPAGAQVLAPLSAERATEVQ